MALFNLCFTNGIDLVEMFHISRYLAMAVSDSAVQGPKPETETIADVWARSIVSSNSILYGINII